MVTHAACCLRRSSSLAIAGVAARLLAQVLPGGDAGRLPQGRRREPVDRQPRPADARPRDRAGLRDGRAVSLGDGARRRRLAVRRHRQRRPRVPDRRAGQGRVVLRRRRARGARAALRRRTAASMSAPRPTARSTRSIAAASRRPSSILARRYIWALAIDAKGNCTRRPARRASSTGSPRTARARGSTRPRRRTSPRWPSTGAAICWSAPSRPAGCFASIPRARRSCCSIRRSRKSARCASTTRACCTWRRSAAGAGTTAAGAHRRAALRTAPPSRRSAPVASVSTEITSIAVVDVSGGDFAEHAGARIGARRGAPCTASRRTACGIELWESRDDSPYDSPSTRAAG